MADRVTVTDADREAVRQVADHLGMTLVTRERELFAQAIARARAEEREACARECEAVCPPAGLYSPGERSAYEAAVQDCAAAIRARGEGGKA